MTIYLTQTMVERELIPKFKSMVLTLRTPKQFIGDEWAYAHKLIWANNLSELKYRFGNYLFNEKALSLAIYAKSYEIVYWLLENNIKASYQHLKEAAMQGSFNLFDYLINAGADLHYNYDEILFYITNYYDKPFHPRTQQELPYLINKYNLQKTKKNNGF